MTQVLTAFILLLLYLVPGFIASRLTLGKLRNNPFWWLLLSYLAVPFIYLVLIYLKSTTLVSYLSVILLFSLLIFFVRTRNWNKLDLDNIFPKTPSSGSRWLSYLTSFVLLLFFVLLIIPRWGLWNGFVPVGDDKSRVGQVLSIAASPNEPLYFRLPTTEMSIYYFHMIQPGLLVRFGENYVKVNQAWFIHLLISYSLLIWLINLITSYFARNQLEKLTMVMSMTFLGGLEFYLYKFKNISLEHLEWWTDWLGEKFYIHTQISSPFTSYFWVTQHVFPTLLVFIAYFLLVSKERKKVISWVSLGVITGALFGNSVFVFLAFVLAYGLYFLIRLFLKKEKIKEVIKMNTVVVLVSLVLSVGMIKLILMSGKESYFFWHASVFYYFKNEGLFKLLNLFLTIPTFLFVELGLFLFVYIYYLYLFIRKKFYLENLLFLYLLTLPLLILFLIRAKGDNNFSMRATLPALSVLAVFSGWLVGNISNRFTKSLTKKALLSVLLIAAFAFMLPSTIWEAKERYKDQFEYADPVFAQIDRVLPLNAIVFADHESLKDKRKDTLLDNIHDSLTHQSHRLTFKPVYLFNITDKEYTSQPAKKELEKYHFAYTYELEEILKKYPQIAKFPVFYISVNEYKLPKVLENKSFNLYRVN